MRNIRKDWRLAVRMLCALALVFVAFTHQPVSASPANDIDLAAYTLPDGSVPVLCLDNKVDQGSHKRMARQWLRGLPPLGIRRFAGSAHGVRLEKRAGSITYNRTGSGPDRAQPLPAIGSAASFLPSSDIKSALDGASRRPAPAVPLPLLSDDWNTYDRLKHGFREALLSQPFALPRHLALAFFRRPSGHPFHAQSRHHRQPLSVQGRDRQYRLRLSQRGSATRRNRLPLRS